jgi:hypothetical protein
VVRELHGSVDELLRAMAGGRVVTREPLTKNADSLSGSPFERVLVDGQPYVLKHIGHDLDWIMRALDDGVDGALPRAAIMWQTGLLDELPPVIDHTIVAMAYDPATGHCAILMRDAGPALVPTGSSVIPFAQHRAFLEHMAAMHATFWDKDAHPGLLPPGARYTALTPAMSAREAAAGHHDPIPEYVPNGWAALREAAPQAYHLALALATDPAPLVRALAETPATLIHGDWKYGNLGSTVDGRTVLLDWGWPGRDGPCVDVGWYLAVNCDRLPESKEDAATAVRAALERHGVSTMDWWDRQLELALLGAFVQLGWSKTHDPVELEWWTSRVLPVGKAL